MTGKTAKTAAALQPHPWRGGGRSSSALRRAGVWFVLPGAALVLSIIGYAVLQAGWLSLTNKQVGQPAQFIGLRNYTELVMDPVYRRTLWNTLVYTVGGVGTKSVLGMLMALALNRKMQGRDALSALLLLPWILPTAISTLIWMWMFDDHGLLNYVLEGTGVVGEGVAWLATPTLAMFSVIMVGVWREVPYFGLNLLAGMQSIPADQYEAAGIDGAGTLRQFWHVTLPNLRSLFLLTMMLSGIQSAYEFSTVYILTRGGPSGATNLFSTMTFQTAFEIGKMGKAVAISLLAMPVFVPVLYLVTRQVQRGET